MQTKLEVRPGCVRGDKPANHALAVGKGKCQAWSHGILKAAQPCMVYEHLFGNKMTRNDIIPWRACAIVNQRAELNRARQSRRQEQNE